MALQTGLESGLVKTAQYLKGIPDSVLRQYSQRPDGRVPPYLVFAELNWRNELRKRGEGGEPPTQTVAEDVIAGYPAGAVPPAKSGPMEAGLGTPRPKTQRSMSVAPNVQNIRTNTGVMAGQGFRRGGPVRRYGHGGHVERPGSYVGRLVRLGWTRDEAKIMDEHWLPEHIEALISQRLAPPNVQNIRTNTGVITGQSEVTNDESPQRNAELLAGFDQDYPPPQGVPFAPPDRRLGGHQPLPDDGAGGEILNEIPYNPFTEGLGRERQEALEKRRRRIVEMTGGNVDNAVAVEILSEEAARALSPLSTTGIYGADEAGTEFRAPRPDPTLRAPPVSDAQSEEILRNERLRLLGVPLPGVLPVLSEEMNGEDAVINQGTGSGITPLPDYYSQALEDALTGAGVGGASSKSYAEMQASAMEGLDQTDPYAEYREMFGNEEGAGYIDPVNEALMRMGLGLLASDDPNFLNAAGTAGLGALEGYQESMTKRRKEHREDRADKLALAQLTETHRIAQENIGFRLADGQISQEQAAREQENLRIGYRIKVEELQRAGVEAVGKREIELKELGIMARRAEIEGDVAAKPAASVQYGEWLLQQTPADLEKLISLEAAGVPGYDRANANTSSSAWHTLGKEAKRELEEGGTPESAEYQRLIWSENPAERAKANQMLKQLTYEKFTSTYPQYKAYADRFMAVGPSSGGEGSAAGPESDPANLRD